MNKKMLKLIEFLLILIIVFFVGLIVIKIIPFLKICMKIFIPFLIAFAFAFILQPIINFLINKGVKKKFAISITFFFFFLIIFLFFYFCIPIINKQLNIFINNIPYYLEKINLFLEQLKNKLAIIPNDYDLSAEVIFDYFFTRDASAMNKVITFIESIISYIVPIIITPILTVYFVIYYDEIEKKIKEKTVHFPTLYKILSEIKRNMHIYFKAFFTIIGLLSLLATISFLLLGLDFFFLWGIVIGITDIIPYIGPYLGGGIVLLFVLTSNSSLFIYTLIIIVCLQIIEGCFLTPKIQSKSMKINPILVIFSITFLGKLFGIFGMIIAVPIISILQIIFKNIILLKKM